MNLMKLNYLKLQKYFIILKRGMPKILREYKLQFFFIYLLIIYDNDCKCL